MWYVVVTSAARSSSSKRDVSSKNKLNETKSPCKWWEIIVKQKYVKKRLKINEITNIYINISNTMSLLNSTLDFLHETWESAVEFFIYFIFIFIFVCLFDEASKSKVLIFIRWFFGCCAPYFRWFWFLGLDVFFFFFFSFSFLFFYYFFFYFIIFDFYSVLVCLTI